MTYRTERERETKVFKKLSTAERDYYYTHVKRFISDLKRSSERVPHHYTTTRHTLFAYYPLELL
jgi:hypothetical protein